MIGYFDTSSVVPLLVEEPSSTACRRFWDDADAVTSTRLMYVEAAAALAQAHRMERLTRRQHVRAVALLDRIVTEIEFIELDQRLAAAAAVMAHRCALRGYDAVHCAAAEQLADPDLVAATGDRRLLAAWQQLGVATYDINAPG